MRHLKIPVLALVLLAAVAGTGFAELIADSVQSEIMGEERRVRVRLPADYVGSRASYPLLVVLDGNHLDLAPPDELTLAEILDEMEAAGEIPPVIAIGVLNTDRTRDMTPSPIVHRASSGGAEAFMGFLAEELVPWAESEFRTNGRHVIYGHSLAGLLAIHALLSRPALFQGVIAAGPGLSWDDDIMLTIAREALPGLGNEPHVLYFAIGDRDTYRQFIRSCREFDALLSESAPANLSWRFEVLRGRDHMSIMPDVFRSGLSYVFTQEPFLSTAVTSPSPSVSSP